MATFITDKLLEIINENFLNFRFRKVLTFASYYLWKSKRVSWGRIELARASWSELLNLNKWSSYYDGNWKSAFEYNIFWCQRIFFESFDIKNKGENEFENKNEKSCSRFKNRVPLEIDGRANWTHDSNPTAWELRTGLGKGPGSSI